MSSMTYSYIVAQVARARDTACIDAIYKWASENRIDDVLICDEDKLREVLRLGLAEYQKVYGD